MAQSANQQPNQAQPGQQKNPGQQQSGQTQQGQQKNSGPQQEGQSGKSQAQIDAEGNRNYPPQQNDKSKN